MAKTKEQKEFNVIGEMSVRPAGSDPIVTTLDAGVYEVKITRTRENNELEALYPDDFTRDHQANGSDALAQKILMNFKARYGADATIKTKPPLIKEGAIFEIEVK